MRSIAAFAVVVGLTVGVVGCSSGADDEQPTVTFDGTAAVYSGPSELEGYPERPVFVLVNNSDKAVDFAYGRVVPRLMEGITEQDVEEWDLTHTDPPPWVASVDHLAMRVQGGETVEADGLFIPGNTYELGVWSLFRQRSFFAGWIDVIEPSN